MGVYDPNQKKQRPVPVAPVEKINPNPVAEPLQTIKSDSKLVPRTALLAHIEGSAWFVKAYYSQYLNKNDVPKAFSIDLPAVSQQYRRIDNLELRVQQPLSHNFANGENEFSVTGTSVIYPGLIPNVDDIIVADIGDGQLGRLSVTQCTPMMYLQAAAYEIEYKLIAVLDKLQQANLDLKTVDSVVYVRDQYLSNNRAMLLESEAELYKQMTRLLETLPNEYYREFYSREYATLMIPDQIYKTYDPYLTGFFKRLVDPEIHPWISTVNELNCASGNDDVIFTIFDAALENDTSILDRCYAKIVPTNVRYFNTQSLFASVRYSGFEFVMYPEGMKTDSAYQTTTHKGFTLALGPNITMNRKVRMDEAYSSKTTNLLPGEDGKSLEWISKEAIKDTYVFSPEFYEDGDHQSAVERMFREAVAGNFCDPAKVLKACGDRVLWTSTTRFYYVPIMLYILRVAIANLG